jgi:hypothetical protein
MPAWENYISEGKKELWGFKVGNMSPDYRQFVRGLGSLTQRGFVFQGKDGLVFLTPKRGIQYCQLNSDLLDKGGDAWTQFAPVEP